MVSLLSLRFAIGLTLVALSIGCQSTVHEHATAEGTLEPALVGENARSNTKLAYRPGYVTGNIDALHVSSGNGFTKSVENYVVVTSVSSLEGTGERLAWLIRGRQSGNQHLVVSIGRNTPGKLRMNIKGAIGEVLKNNTFWEEFDITVSLTKLSSESNGPVSIALPSLRMAGLGESGLEKELRKPQGLMELSVEISGSFESGGNIPPSSKKYAYNMESKNDGEMEDYAKMIRDIILRVIVSKNHYDPYTG